MAFHVACPITCRKICFCVLGFPRNLKGNEVKDVFLNEIHSLQDFLRDPWGSEVSKEGTVQIHVPKLAVFDTGPRIAARDVPVGIDSAMEVVAASSVSLPAKRTVVLQKKSAVVDCVANDGSVDFEVSVKELNGEDHDHHSASITCHMCYLVEVGKSEKAKMLSCKCCGKKYHRNCLKPWAQHRDLFNWSSWACPSCRICEGCGTLGDPKKFMFCKRCDAAYHCDCQQPRHKNVGSGPYLCPKHTKCYSCGSTVPGNGQSLRWFLGHTCCDACGRLFVKGNYCPVCLKVYRDSESTPMVCCDFCQRWVHCQCDGISDEKYMQFQVDGNLQYKCSTCRGECYQVKDLEDAVQEIWKRKDMADKELIASLKASARVDGQTGGAPLINQPGSVERKVSEKAIVNGEEEKPLRVLRIKSSRPQDSDSEKFGTNTTELNTVKTKKLVISIGPRKTGVTNSVSCDVSKLASKSNGKQEKLQSEETFSREQHRSLLGKNNDEKRGSRGELATSKAEGGFIGRHSDGRRDLNSGSHDSLPKDSRRLLKLKIKKHNPEGQEGETPSIVDERGKSGKGHRSKRKRASPPAEKSGFNEDEDVTLSHEDSTLDEMLDERVKSGKGHRSKRKRASPPAEKSGFNEDEDVSLSREDSLLDEMLDASWILKKLGKNAKGKIVQIHEASDDSWEKGVVSEVGGVGTSKLMVTLENGKVKTVELGKQGVRFVPQKQKRTRT